MMAKSNVLSLLIHKKYFVDPNIQRTYDFETGLVGPTVVHNFVMSPQQGYGQTQHGYVPAPTEFGQTATAPTLLHEKQVPGSRILEKLLMLYLKSLNNDKNCFRSKEMLLLQRMNNIITSLPCKKASQNLLKETRACNQ